MDEWTKHYSSREKRHYWYNARTKESTWTEPEPAPKRQKPNSEASPAQKPRGEASESVSKQPSDADKSLSASAAAEDGGNSAAKRGSRAVEQANAAEEAAATEESWQAEGTNGDGGASGAAAGESGAGAGEAHEEEAFPEYCYYFPEPVVRPSVPRSEVRNKWERVDLQPNQVLRDIFRTETVMDAVGGVHKFKDGVDPIEGMVIYNLIQDNPWMRRTLEIGCAYGTSALYFTQGLRDAGASAAKHETGFGGQEAEAFHIAIDPNQHSQYMGVGVANVERAGLSDYFYLLEERSYEGMPGLLREVNAGERPVFHLIFIDGWHTFDYTLVDFFYADLLLGVNGVILLDDINHKSVARAVDFIESNYPHYKRVREFPTRTMGCFVKTESDQREWNHFKDF